MKKKTLKQCKDVTICQTEIIIIINRTLSVKQILFHSLLIIIQCYFYYIFFFATNLYESRSESKVTTFLKKSKNAHIFIRCTKIIH